MDIGNVKNKVAETVVGPKKCNLKTWQIQGIGDNDKERTCGRYGNKTTHRW